MTRYSHGFAALALACALVFLTAPAGAAPPPQEEFSAPPAEDGAATAELPSVTVRIEAGGGAQLMLDEDMDDDYGGVPLGDLGMTFEFDQRTQFYFGLGYGHRSVTMDLDDPTFETGETLELELVPVRFALRTNTSPLHSFRMNLGLLLELIHMKETAPYFRTYPVFESGRSADSGWGTRFGLSLGPEWRLADDEWSVGFEVQMVTGGGTVGNAYERDISLEGFGGRVFCTWRLGVFTDAPHGGEVSR